MRAASPRWRYKTPPIVSRLRAVCATVRAQSVFTEACSTLSVANSAPPSSVAGSVHDGNNHWPYKDDRGELVSRPRFDPGLGTAGEPRPRPGYGRRASTPAWVRQASIDPGLGTAGEPRPRPGYGRRASTPAWVRQASIDPGLGTAGEPRPRPGYDRRASTPAWVRQASIDPGLGTTGEHRPRLPDAVESHSSAVARSRWLLRPSRRPSAPSPSLHYEDIPVMTSL